MGALQALRGMIDAWEHVCEFRPQEGDDDICYDDATWYQANQYGYPICHEYCDAHKPDGAIELSGAAAYRAAREIVDEQAMIYCGTIGADASN
jgi:hypothetical protein